MKLKGTPQEVYEKISEYLEKNKDKKEIVIFIGTSETKEMRTLWQNNFWYGIFGEIEKQTIYSEETIKSYLLGRTFGKELIFDEWENKKTKTSELTKKEAREFLESLLIFMQEHSLSCKYTSRDFQSLIDSYN